MCTRVAADRVDGYSQADGLHLLSNRDVLARSHAARRRPNQERRRIGERISIRVYQLIYLFNIYLY